jgi:hypothetical protein
MRPKRQSAHHLVFTMYYQRFHVGGANRSALQPISETLTDTSSCFQAIVLRFLNPAAVSIALKPSMSNHQPFSSTVRLIPVFCVGCCHRSPSRSLLCSVILPSKVSIVPRRLNSPVFLPREHQPAKNSLVNCLVVYLIYLNIDLFYFLDKNFINSVLKCSCNQLQDLLMAPQRKTSLSMRFQNICSIFMSSCETFFF